MEVIYGTQCVVDDSDGVFLAEVYISCLRQYFLEVTVDMVHYNEQVVLNIVLSWGDDIKDLACEGVLVMLT